jgi:hypothetical protein
MKAKVYSMGMGISRMEVDRKPSAQRNDQRGGTLADFGVRYLTRTLSGHQRYCVQIGKANIRYVSTVETFAGSRDVDHESLFCRVLGTDEHIKMRAAVRKDQKWDIAPEDTLQVVFDRKWGVERCRRMP